MRMRMRIRESFWPWIRDGKYSEIPDPQHYPQLKQPPWHLYARHYSPTYGKVATLQSKRRIPDVHLLPVDVVPVELEKVERAGHPLVPVLLTLQHVPVVCTPCNIMSFRFLSQKCRRMLGSNQGLLRFLHWQSDALTTRLDLIHLIPVLLA